MSMPVCSESITLLIILVKKLLKTTKFFNAISKMNKIRKEGIGLTYY